LAFVLDSLLVLSGMDTSAFVLYLPLVWSRKRRVMDLICLITRFGFAVAAAVDICQSAFCRPLAARLAAADCSLSQTFVSLVAAVAVGSVCLSVVVSVSSPVGRPNSRSVLHDMEASA
jgi:hypothetical protein